MIHVDIVLGMIVPIFAYFVFTNVLGQCQVLQMVIDLAALPRLEKDKTMCMQHYELELYNVMYNILLCSLNFLLDLQMETIVVQMIATFYNHQLFFFSVTVHYIHHTGLQTHNIISELEIHEQ